MDAHHSHPIRNLVIFVLPLALIAGLGVYYYSLGAYQQPAPRMALPQTFLKHALTAPTKLVSGLVDADGDLVADAPKDPKEQLDPDKLVFAVLGQDADAEAKRFEELAAHLAKATGKKVEVTVWQGTIPEQMNALRKGTLHIADVSTGSVSTAVNEGGLVPFAVMADRNDKFGYHMEFIVPADSPIKSPADLKGTTISLASPHSHSGFKVPLVVLWKDFQLEPGLDYNASIEGDQEKVLTGVASGKFKAGAVASDLRKRMIAAGKVDPAKIRTIYTSATFPPQCFGYAHQLKPELTDKIKDAFRTFSWEGSGLEKSFAAAGQNKFVAVSYKSDWEPVRQMEEMAARFVKK